MGFKTFEPFINESYDNEVHSGKRMGMIVDEVERLCSMSFGELSYIYKKLIPILKHNRDILLNKKTELLNLLDTI
jgi:superfamily II DNA/RNA helicase